MLRRIQFIGLWAALVLMLGLAGPAAAQRGDEGEYQILSARYGTAMYNVDVTQRLKELARQDQRFRMGNNSFGTDPHPNHVKTLRIYARGRDGNTRTFEYAEGSWVDGAQFTGWGGGNWGEGGWTGGWGGGGNREDDGEYQILQARYGTYDRNEDVTQRLKELARQDRRFRMGNSSFGVDPAPNQVKTLRIFARGRDGQNRTFEYTEGSVVDGSLFTGWGSGNWGQGGWTGGWGGSSHAGSNNQGYRPGSGRGDLNIIYATYGASGRQRDITYRLRARVVNDRINVRVDNELAGGDPAPNTEKWLWVTYTVDSGAEQRVRINENQRLSLP